MSGYELSLDAEADLGAIAAYTLRTWGVEQTLRYELALTTCIESLASGDAVTSTPIPHRPELRAVRCGHHYVFALRRSDGPILILAVLHESMDLLVRLRSRLEPH
jgi:plasmid stabilization system protein ParE